MPLSLPLNFNSFRLRKLCCIGAASILSTIALGQETQPSTEVVEAVNAAPRWQLRFEPAVWFTGPGGKLKLPSSTSGGDVLPASLQGGDEDEIEIADLEIDTPEPSLGGEVHLSRGDWRFALRGYVFSGDEDTQATGSGSFGALPYAIGDRIATSLDYSSFEFETGYSFVRRSLQPYEGGYRLNTNLEGLVGVRVYNMDWKVENLDGGGVNLQADETFIEPLVGGRFLMEFYEKFDIDLQLTLGGMPLGDQSSVSLDVMVGGTYRPVQNVGVQIGYRLTGFGLESGEDDEAFEFSGSMAGLYAGIVLEF